MEPEVGESGAGGPAQVGANGGSAGAAGSPAGTPGGAPAQQAPVKRGRGWKVVSALLFLLLCGSLALNALLLSGQRTLESEAAGLGMSLAASEARADRAERELDAIHVAVGSVHRGIVALQAELATLAETIAPAALAPVEPDPFAVEPIEPAAPPSAEASPAAAEPGGGDVLALDAQPAPPDVFDFEATLGPSPLFDAFEPEATFGAGLLDPVELETAEPAPERSVPAPDVFGDPDAFADPLAGAEAPVAAEPPQEGPPLLERVVDGARDAARDVRDIFSEPEGGARN